VTPSLEAEIKVPLSVEVDIVPSDDAIELKRQEDEKTLRTALDRLEKACSR